MNLGLIEATGFYMFIISEKDAKLNSEKPTFLRSISILNHSMKIDEMPIMQTQHAQSSSAGARR